MSYSTASAVCPPTVGRIWTPGMMSSLRSDWATPRALFEMLNREFNFTLDVCASSENALCKEYFSVDALDRLWVPVDDGSVWCNPPYGRQVGAWVEKAWRETVNLHRDIRIVLLLPARTDTQWFHDYCLRGEIRFLRGRLSFDNQRIRGRAPFPSMIVVFRKERTRCTL